MWADEAANDLFNVYQSPWPADYTKDFRTAQNAYSAAMLGEISPKDAMKRAAETVNKSHGLSPCCFLEQLSGRCPGESGQGPPTYLRR